MRSFSILLVAVAGCNEAASQTSDAAATPVDKVEAAYDPSGCKGHVEVPDTTGGNRNISFLAMGDVHFEHPEVDGCSRASHYRVDQQDLMLDALNEIETQDWPNGHGFIRAGLPFNAIRGVLVAGDVTDDGGQPLVGSPTAMCPEWATFEQTYGLCGDRELRYPVYEGYGNHDFPFLAQASSTFHPVTAKIAARNPLREGLTMQAVEDHAHYAWRWDDIDFVNLDVKPSGTPANPRVEAIDKDSLGERRVNPLAALTFLDNYLDSNVVKKNAQVVIMTHYGPDNGSRIPALEKAEFCDVLEKYRKKKNVRVIAWIHGHTHHTDYYQWTCPAPDQEIKIPVFNVGSPFYGLDSNGGYAHFAAFRIGNDWLDAVDISVPIAAPNTYEIPGHVVREDTSVYDPDGKLGGWAVHLPIDRP